MQTAVPDPASPTTPNTPTPRRTYERRPARTMAGEQLFTSSDLARMCQVDIKTIHNWTGRENGIKGFMTPGRHLRFKAADVQAFLRGIGYSVPAEVTEALEPDAGGAAVEVDEEPTRRFSELTKSYLARFAALPAAERDAAIGHIADTLDMQSTARGVIVGLLRSFIPAGQR